MKIGTFLHFSKEHRRCCRDESGVFAPALRIFGPPGAPGAGDVPFSGTSPAKRAGFAGIVQNLGTSPAPAGGKDVRMQKGWADEICSGAGRLRTSRTVREQSAGRCGRRPLSVCGRVGRERALDPAHPHTENAAPCGAASALLIALRGEDEIRTRDTVTRMQV